MDNKRTQPDGHLAIATAGRWGAPSQCEPRDMLGPRDWRLLDPTGSFDIFRVTSADAPSPAVARANAFVLAAARDSLQLVTELAGRRRTEPAPDLVERAGALIRDVGGQDNPDYTPAQHQPGEAPAGTGRAPTSAAQPAPDGAGNAQALVVYLDRERTLRRHRCPGREAMEYTRQLPLDAGRAFVFYSCDGLDIDDVLRLAPSLRNSIEQAEATLRRDALAFDAMDKHRIPAEPGLRAAIRNLVGELLGGQ